MTWESVRGQDTAISLLRATVQQGRLAHAYLFVGPAGIGKRTVALKLAQCLFCERHSEAELVACGTCPGCKQVLAGSHPDLFVVGCREGKRELTIDVFIGPPERRGQAGLCYDLSHTPLAGGRKIAIIDDAERMNDESANALLKTLEEPPPKSVLILLATDLDPVLPTIRSRCQLLRFQPLSESVLSELLVEQEIVEDATAARDIAQLADGSLETARTLLDAEFRQQREMLFQRLGDERFNSLKITDEVQKAVESAGETSEQRRRAQWLLRLAVEFYRAVLWSLTTGGMSGCLTIPAAEKLAQRWAAAPEILEALTEILQRIQQTSAELDQNVGVALALETLWDDLGLRLRSFPLVVAQ